MLQRFLQWTAWPMQPPAPYGAFHLCFFFAGLLFSLAAAYLLRKTDKRQNRVILLSVGSFLLLSEIYKQLFYTFVIGHGAYQWWIFPFQLCSVPMYLCFLAALAHRGRVKQCCYDFMVSFNLLGGFISFLEPSGLIHEYWTLTLHAFIWHMVLVFLGLYLAFSGRGARKITDFRHAVTAFLALCAIAFSINLLLWKVSGGTIKMFYIGPAITPLAVFEDIAARFGWYVNTPVYMACLCLGAWLFFRPLCALHERRKRPLLR